MAAHGIESWVQQFRRRKWNWAGELVRHEGGKWSRKVLQWNAELEKEAARCKGRPATRWDDSFADFIATTAGTEDWKTVAKNTAEWIKLEHTYTKA